MTHVEGDKVQPPPKHTNAHPAVVTSDTARQAPRGTRVLIVLLVALGLIAVAFAALYVTGSLTGLITSRDGA